MLTPVRPFRLESVQAPQGLAAFRWPEAWASLPLSEAPLDLEIGCGVGWHPVRYAKENPNRRLIAIEHTRAKFEKFQSRYARHPELTQLLPVHADAIRWVSHVLKPDSVSKCLLLYPNPEPKAPNKRWFRSPFMHRLIEVLEPGGEILLATNEEEYWKEAIAYGQDFWNLEVQRRREFTQDTLPEGLPRTHFERKYLLRGETCFDVTFSKPLPRPGGG